MPKLVDVAGDDAVLGLVTGGEPRDTHPSSLSARGAAPMHYPGPVETLRCLRRRARRRTWPARARGARRPGRRVGPAAPRRAVGAARSTRSTTSCSPTTPSGPPPLRRWHPGCGRGAGGCGGVRRAARATPDSPTRSDPPEPARGSVRAGLSVSPDHLALPARRWSSRSGGCWSRRRGVRRPWAASGCTSGRWCTG